MMATGGWGASTHQYRFNVRVDAVILSSHSSLYFERNVFFFEEITIDFINGTVKFDYSNESERKVEWINHVFNPGEQMSVEKSLPGNVSSSFREISQDSMWNIYDDLLPD